LFMQFFVEFIDNEKIRERYEQMMMCTPYMSNYYLC
jgi:hypothetical protein